MKYEYADIEDLFNKADYLVLYNGAFELEIEESELDDSEGIMQQLKNINDNGKFNHYSPARYMMSHIGELNFSEDTLSAFEKVFREINKLSI